MRPTESEKRSVNLSLQEDQKTTPNTTYLVTRRCTQRLFLLKPTPLSVQVFTYCLAVVAKETGILVHAVTVTSNHYHVVCTDPRGQLPDFMRDLNKLVAKCLNASLGRWENFPASKKPNAVALEKEGSPALGVGSPSGASDTF